MTEEWRDVVGSECCYQVSNLGRVRSKVRKVLSKGGSYRSVCSRILKTSPDKDGYRVLTLSCHGVRRFVRVHILVAEAFIPFDKTLEEREVNHIDGVTGNNCVSNLEWVTGKGNAEHREKMRISRGEPTETASFTIGHVRDIRRRFKQGESVISILASYPHVTRSAVNCVANGHSWRWLKDED